MTTYAKIEEMRNEISVCAGCGAMIAGDESLCPECLEQLMGNELVWEKDGDEVDK